MNWTKCGSILNINIPYGVRLSNAENENYHLLSKSGLAKSGYSFKYN
jgi:hypothetical protein